MTVKKTHDLAVVTGEYQDQQGNTKKKYLNVGVVMEKTFDDGNKTKFLLLDRTFNPAGIPNPEGHSNVAINIFAPRDNNGQHQQQQAAPAANTAPAANNNFDDEIPF